MEIVGHAAWGFMWGMVISYSVLRRWGGGAVGGAGAADGANGVHGTGAANKFCVTGVTGFLMVVYALVPDYGALWGDYSTDKDWWADVFLFGKVLDDFELFIDDVVVMRVIELSFMLVGLALLSRHVNVIRGEPEEDALRQYTIKRMMEIQEHRGMVALLRIMEERRRRNSVMDGIERQTAGPSRRY